MNTLRIIYHLARADFYERVRRYSFLIMLALVTFLGYQSAIGNMTVQLGSYRGVFNSAWVGSMMSLIAAFFLGWFGFFLVKGAVARDRETGVGQIMAATPLKRISYVIGKWISNFLVLTAMVLILALAGILIQYFKGESAQIDLFAFLAPFFFLTLPLMAMVAVIAVLFETIPFLQGGFGNLVYFFAFITGIVLFIASIDAQHIAFEPTGIALLENDMSQVLHGIEPTYDGGFTLGKSSQEAGLVFPWEGLNWTIDILLVRATYFGFAAVIAVFAALLFDRFDPSRRKPGKTKQRDSAPDLVPATVAKPLPKVQLTPLNAASNQFNFYHILLAELKLLIKGQRWWWYLVALGLVVAAMLNPADVTRGVILPITWVWPILIWSSIGNREIYNNVQQMAFSSPFPMWRQLPAQWLAGFILAITVASGAILRLAIAGDFSGLLLALIGSVFIPSLALASGVWSNGSKLFEILYVLVWYLGPINRMPELDYIGATQAGNPQFFLIVSIALIVFASYGRARKIQN